MNAALSCCSEEKLRHSAAVHCGLSVSLVTLLSTQCMLPIVILQTVITNWKAEGRVTKSREIKEQKTDPG